MRRSRIQAALFFLVAAIVVLAEAGCIDTENCARKSDCGSGLICVANACVIPPVTTSDEGGVSSTSDDDAGIPDTTTTDPNGG